MKRLVLAALAATISLAVAAPAVAEEVHRDRPVMKKVIIHRDRDHRHVFRDRDRHHAKIVIKRGHHKMVIKKEG
jgi:hypothetical protein